MSFKIKDRMEVKPGDLKWWLAKHDEYKWRYAVTMPFAPHSYIWREKEMTAEDYDRMFGVVMTFGEPGKYWDRTQLYLVNEERDIRYWLMDYHYYTCKILNMATDGQTYGVQNAPSTKTSGWSEYDAISPWWDDIYRELEKYDRTAIWKTVHANGDFARPSCLDIGAGTGATLDSRVAPSMHTTAVDPSQGMLNYLVLKYPDIGAVFPGTFAEFVEDRGHPKSDVVIASAGSASYLTPQEIVDAQKCAKHLMVLSFYTQTPPHRGELPETHDAAFEQAKRIPGSRVMEHEGFTHVVSHG